jgi:urease accessory protein
MIIEKVLGKIGDAAFSGRAADPLDVEWYNANKKIDRKMTRGGKDAGIRMDHRTSHMGFTQDDIVYDDGESLVAVNILPCACISVRAESTAELARLCYEIGNRHAPFFYGENEGEFLTPYEKPVMAMIEKLGLAPQVVEARLLPEKRISSAHGHAHSH